MTAPPNGLAADGKPWAFKRSGTRERRKRGSDQEPGATELMSRAQDAQERTAQFLSENGADTSRSFLG